MNKKCCNQSCHLHCIAHTSTELTCLLPLYYGHLFKPSQLDRSRSTVRTLEYFICYILIIAKFCRCLTFIISTYVSSLLQVVC